MPRMKELEDENRRLKKRYLEDKRKGEIVAEALEKSGEAISQMGDGPQNSDRTRRMHRGGVPGIWHQRILLPLRAQTRCRERRGARWLMKLMDKDRSWGFGLCYLYLRNVKGFKWNHKRV